MKYSEYLKIGKVKKNKFKESLSIKQSGCCAICGRFQVKAAEIKGIRNLYNTDRRFAVDHNHDTDEIRGLLCQLCNTMLGLAGDNIEILQRAIYYLEIGICESKPNKCLRNP